MKLEGVIGVPCADLGRYSAFWECVYSLDTPGPGWVIKQERGASVAKNRNEIVRFGLEHGAEYFFFLDDDLLFGPSVLTRLLAHQIDAVVGLTLQRDPPFAPLISTRTESDGRAYWYELQPGDRGLLKIKSATSGGLLVRRKVFETMPAPWWTLGQINPEVWGDDLDFCRKLDAAGFTLWADLEVPFNHLTTVVVAPNRQPNGTWSTVLARSTPFVEIVPPQAERRIKLVR